MFVSPIKCNARVCMFVCVTYAAPRVCTKNKLNGHYQGLCGEEEKKERKKVLDGEASL